MNPLLIYFWGQADHLRQTFIVGSFVTFVLAFALLTVPVEENVKIVRSWGRRVALIFLFFVLIATLMPDSKTLAAMIIVPEIVKSKAIQQDLPQVYDLAIKKLKEELK